MRLEKSSKIYAHSTAKIQNGRILKEKIIDLGNRSRRPNRSNMWIIFMGI